MPRRRFRRSEHLHLVAIVVNAEEFQHFRRPSGESFDLHSDLAALFELADLVLEPAKLLLPECRVAAFERQHVVVGRPSKVRDDHAILDPLLEVDVLIQGDIRPEVNELDPLVDRADAVDAAIDAMSGLTSQPNLGSLVEALRHGPRDSGLDPDKVRQISALGGQ